MSKDHYSFEDLKYLMARLRDQNDGCPWDVKQTFKSIVPHTLEEVYEVIDTIEREDFTHLSEELGDLLFQVVFYAQMASEEDRFNLDGVIDGLVKKLIFRHPHVFPLGTLQSRRQSQEISESAVGQQWEALKAKEKGNNSASILADVPQSLPGLLRAKKLQANAAKVGFDWPSLIPVFEKVNEELDELKEAVQSGNLSEIESELGDVLFVLANVARHCNVDPEQAIRATNRKFERRFGHVEAKVSESARPWSEYSLDELDGFWDEAKMTERK